MGVELCRVDSPTPPKHPPPSNSATRENKAPKRLHTPREPLILLSACDVANQVQVFRPVQPPNSGQLAAVPSGPWASWSVSDEEARLTFSLHLSLFHTLPTLATLALTPPPQLCLRQTILILPPPLHLSILPILLHTRPPSGRVGTLPFPLDKDRWRFHTRTRATHTHTPRILLFYHTNNDILSPSPRTLHPSRPLFAFDSIHPFTSPIPLLALLHSSHFILHHFTSNDFVELATMDSPQMPSISIDPPRNADRRRRGRGVDVMSACVTVAGHSNIRVEMADFGSMPTPERPQQHHLPTPVTQRRRTDNLAPSDKMAVHLPTPQTLPRKRASPSTVDPTSPSGHTSFFFAQSGTMETAERVPPRRRPGLMFAQQMGLTQTTMPAAAEIKFGGRLGVGVGMGGVMRNSPHGPVDKVSLENPFLVHPSSSSRTANLTPDDLASASRPAPPAPGAETSYVPQALRPSAERSLSPHPRRRPRAPGAPASPTPAHLLVPGGAGPSTSAARRRQMMDEDNPFIAKPGEVVRPRPTREDNPQVTYVL